MATHAAGVVIAGENLSEQVPLYTEVAYNYGYCELLSHDSVLSKGPQPLAINQ